MSGEQPGIAAKVLEQRCAVPRILSGYPIDTTQHIDCALRHVTEITKRRRDYI